jgi:uncharacterized membrane protein
MPIVAEVGSGAYNTVLTLHILAVVVGFGAIALSGLAAGRAGSGSGGAAVVRSHWTVARGWAMWAVYAAFVLGIGLVLMSDEAWGFGDPWLSAAMGIYIVGVGAFHMLLAPARKQLASGAGDLAAAGKRLALGTAILDVVLVVNLALMIWKPD